MMFQTKQALRAQILVLLLVAVVLAGCGAGGAATVPSASPSTATPSLVASASAAPSLAPAPSASAAASPEGTASAAASAAPAGSAAPNAASEPYGAAQTILDYYTAINAQQYDAAYALWARAGAASDQTLEQFRAGFGSTVQSAVQLGQLPASAGATVTVPVTVLAVSNDPSASNGQRVEEFAGTYTLERTGAAAAWKIGSAQIAAVQRPTLPPAERADAATLLTAYYDAINRGDYAQAYSYWNNGERGSDQSLTDFAAGFAGTRAVTFAAGTADAGGAAGSIYSTVPVVIVASQTDGTAATYCGTYTLRRLNVPPFDQLGWRIEGAQIGTTAAVTLGSAEANALLAGGCATK